MLKLFRLALAGLALVCAVSANAPAWAGVVIRPAGSVPEQACAWGAEGATVNDCTADSGLPVGKITDPSANFTTPAGVTAYTAADLIANSGTAGSVTPMSFTVCRADGAGAMIRGARFNTTDSGFAGKSVILKLYRTSPTVTNGDNGAWLSTRSSYIGSITVAAAGSFTFSDPLYGGTGPVTSAEGPDLTFTCTGGVVIYGLEVAGEAITPQGAKVHTWTLEVLNP